MSAWIPIGTVVWMALASGGAVAMSSEALYAICTAKDDQYKRGLCDGIIVATLQGAYRGIAEQAKVTDTPLDMAGFRKAMPVCLPGNRSQEDIVSAVRQYIEEHRMIQLEMDGPSLVLHAYKRRFPCRWSRLPSRGTKP